MTSHANRSNLRARTTPRVALCAALLTGAALLAACTSGATMPDPPQASPGSSSSATSSSATRSSAPPVSKPAPVRAAMPVHIKLRNDDGATYGVGMPVIAYFSRNVTDGRPLQRATTVTVDGVSAQGAWYFEPSAAGNGPMEAHLRLREYWKPHARVHVKIAAQGVSAGRGLVYENGLTSDFTTGAQHIVKVDDARHQLTVESDGRTWGTFPVSLGAAATPTLRGTKVIMERVKLAPLVGPSEHQNLMWTLRVTYDGEYLHAAPWNEGPSGNIGRADSSNGCTNLTTRDARRLFGFLRVGDVVDYVNAAGRTMRLGDGYGDWNLDWNEWLTGGAVATH